MGLYSVVCLQCNKPFMWFSGNLDQRCNDCKNPYKELKTMDHQQAHLDSLNKVIAVQNELITFLKAEIERLKTASISINTPNSGPIGSPTLQPQYPYTHEPFLVNPPSAVDPHIYPLNPPYYTTISGQTTTPYISGPIITGDPLVSTSSISVTSPSVPNCPETPESLRDKRKK